MKYFAVLLLIFGSPLVLAKSKSLILMGTVPLQADVHVVKDKKGRVLVQSRGSAELKTEVLKRGPASIVRVSAP